MDPAMEKNACDRGHKFNRECLVLTAGLLLMLLVLSRYVVNGQPVDIRSDNAKTEIGLPLSDDVEIMQPMIITEEMNWRQGYYALRFTYCDKNSDGRVVYTVRQGEALQKGSIALCDIDAGEWTRLSGLSPGRLEAGEALLMLSTEGVAQGALEIGAGEDYYGFGIAEYNGVKQSLTLAQAYHYHIVDMEYRIRLVCYALVLLCVLLLILLVRDGRIGDKGKSLAAFGVMTVLFMAVIYLLDSSIYIQPTYAEAVTNFLKFAREKKFMDNLLVTDAGYLPLLPRLITLFFVKVLRVPAAYALYLMQFTACLLCSMIWSFFVLYPFHRFMKLSGRILWCILVMLTCFYEETLFFTNHAYWGIYFLLLMMIADLNVFPRWLYAVLTAFGAVFCLSKGTYAVVLPLAVLAMVFFYRSMDRREKVFLCTAGAAALLQILYSFSGQGDGGSWVSAAANGGIAYWIRLVCRAFVEFTAYLLRPLGGAINRIPIVILLLTLVAIGFLVAGFTGKVLLSLLRGKKVSRPQRNFWLIVMYQMIVTVFFLVTVKAVPDSWKNMGFISFRQMGHKYEIFSSIGFYLLLLTGSGLLRQAAETGAANAESAAGNGIWHGIYEIGSRYGILALTAVFCLTHPVMQLTGWAQAKTSDGRVYAGDINADWQACKDMIYRSSFFVPVRDGNWGYSRNATVYQVGADVYFEETSCVNLEEKIAGYRNTYEIQDEATAQNLIGVMIDRPERIPYADCRIRLLDADDQVIAETGQTGGGRYKKCYFTFADPVSGVKKMEFVDADGEPVWYKDYIAWITAW